MPGLLELLPVSPNAVLKTADEKVKFLQTYRYFVETAIDAMQTFLAGDLQKFDAHVGDTACQIRAYHVFYLFSDEQQHVKIKTALAQYKNLWGKVNRVIDTIDMEHNRNNSPSVDNLLSLSGLHMSTTWSILFLIRARFLNLFIITDVKFKFSLEIDYEKMRESLSFISKSLLKNIVKSFQAAVSKDSCDFIHKLAQEINISRQLEGAVDIYMQLDEKNRTVMPIFLSSYIIIQHMLCKNISLCIHAVFDGEKAWFVMKPNQEQNNFEITSDCDSCTGPLFIIKGDTHGFNTPDMLKAYLENLNFLELFLSRMAEHKQYAGKKLQELDQNIFSFSGFESSQELATIKRAFFLMLDNAKKVKNNSRYFWPCHIYSGRIAA